MLTQAVAVGKFVMMFIIIGYAIVFDLSPTMSYFLFGQYAIALGVQGILMACLMEGKRVPTCLTRWCRCARESEVKGRRKLSGLQLTCTLGKALALLTKHGLDTQRRQDSPVEAEVEVLLSTAPLMVAAAPDMDLMRCVDYLLDRCVDAECKIATRFVQMPVGRLLRGGCNQHEVKPFDIAHLRSKTKKCLQVSMSVCVRLRFSVGQHSP